MATLTEKLNQDILDTVIENFDYLRSNPSHLAWTMMHYELLCRIGGKVEKEEMGNQKYPVIDAGEKLSSEKDRDLLYDAWCISSDHVTLFPDVNPHWPLETKVNKTFEEWVSYLTDKKYRFSELYVDPDFSSELKVSDDLLCKSGRDYRWNHDGFLVEIENAGTEKLLFAGYTRVEDQIRPQLREKVNSIIDHPQVKVAAQTYLSKARENAARLYAGEEWYAVIDPSYAKFKELKQRVEKMIEQLPESDRRELGFDEKRTSEKETRESPHKTFNVLSEHSNLMTMPKNAHHSYVAAGIRVANLMLQHLQEPLESRTFAQEFLHTVTMRALEDIPAGCTSFEQGIGATATMWYDEKTGTIYGFGDGRPQIAQVMEAEPVRIKFSGKHGEEGPLPELPQYVSASRTLALETALNSIRAFREKMNLSK